MLFFNWLCQLAKYGRIDEADLDQMIEEYENSEEVEHMLTIVSLQERERLVEEGREEGREEGAISAKRETLIQILEHKFDQVSSSLLGSIHQADRVEELDDWINRALSAQSLSDLWI